MKSFVNVFIFVRLIDDEFRLDSQVENLVFIFVLLLKVLWMLRMLWMLWMQQFWTRQLMRRKCEHGCGMISVWVRRRSLWMSTRMCSRL